MRDMVYEMDINSIFDNLYDDEMRVLLEVPRVMNPAVEADNARTKEGLSVEEVMSSQEGDVGVHES